MKTRLTERDITRIVRRVVNEQNEFDSPPPEGKILVKDKDGKERYVTSNTKQEVDDGKSKLIQVLRNHLNSMENDDDFSALGVAQVMYNDCAHWMNKTDMFSSRPGEPTNDTAEFAPDNDY